MGSNERMTKVCLVIPCFNEALRIDKEKFSLLIREANVNDIDLHLHFVNDCSTDKTREILEQIIIDDTENTRINNLDTNVGKAEAIRITMAAFSNSDREFIGFMDADFAIPPLAVLRFIRTSLLSPEYEYFWASRIPLLGSKIQRSRSRHLSGRTFNFVIRKRLKLDIYDSQCGLKLLRNTTKLHASLREPIPDQWLFDLVLLQRLLEKSDQKTRQNVALEVPVIEWDDVRGSKVTLMSGLRTLVNAARL